MCVSVAPASFAETILYMGEIQHLEYGLVHMLGYQNTALNLSQGPNAMILHLPAADLMTSTNILDTSQAGNILHDMVEAVRPKARSASFGKLLSAGIAIQIFSHDIYTIVLARGATVQEILGALQSIQTSKRPTIDPAIIDFYRRYFPRHTLAFCCFDNREAKQASPMLWWYKPIRTDFIFAPAIDCHSGASPNINDLVDVDHWVIASSDQLPSNFACRVAYQDNTLPIALQQFLPNFVVGQQFKGRYPNRDFLVEVESLRSGRDTRIVRALVN